MLVGCDCEAVTQSGLGVAVKALEGKAVTETVWVKVLAQEEGAGLVIVSVYVFTPEVSQLLVKGPFVPVGLPPLQPPQFQV